MYTLKLEWSRERIHAVHAALGPPAPARAAHPRRELAGYLEVDEAGATLKFGWTPQQIDGVLIALAGQMARLEQDMLRARDNQPGPTYEQLVATQTQLAAAAREIRDYRAANHQGTGAHA